MIETGMTDLRVGGRMDLRRRDRIKMPVPAHDMLPRAETPIVARNSIAGRALVAVVAIMTFLASLTVGAVMLVRAAASDWQSDVSREITIQVRPVAGRDFEAEVQRAVEIARNAPGIAEVRAYSKAESAGLLEPWLGTGLALDDLPVPRMIVVRLAADRPPDLVSLRKALGQVSGATLDDHRAWVERMRAMTRTSVAGGLGILGLMLAATMLSVAFATRGTMATNRPIVEVLHFVGAKDTFIANQFQRHFLVLGLEGGAIGGGAAIVLFILARLFGSWGATTLGGEQLAGLFGTFALGLGGYAAIVLQVMLIATVTAVTSRRTVNQTLQSVA
jgi:cell division transport system permease protein